MRLFKENFLQIILIILLTLFVWHKILDQVFLGEGYMYFGEKYNLFKLSQSGFLEIREPGRSDNFARLLFDIFPPIFRDDITAYLYLQILFMILLYISLYFVVREITKNKFAAFSTTLFVLANYIGSYDLFATGNYQRFIQRIPNFIPIIFSFYFLYQFFNLKKPKYYIYSIAFYCLGVLMSHFSSLILPLFFIYPLAKLISFRGLRVRGFLVLSLNRFVKVSNAGSFNLTSTSPPALRRRGSVEAVIDNPLKGKRVLLHALISFSFLIVTLLITKNSEVEPRSLMDFLKNEPNLIERVLFQIPLITLPPDLVIFIAKSVSKQMPEPYLPIIKSLLFPTFLIYLLGFVIVFKKIRHLTILYLTCFFAMLSSMLLYMYIDPRLNPLKYFGADRYFFVSTLLASMTWGLIVYAIILNKRNMYKVFVIFFLMIYLSYNTFDIWRDIAANQYKSEIIKQFIGYVKSQYPKFDDKTIIVAPIYLFWTAPIFTEFGPPGLQAVITYDGWEKELSPQKQDVYIFDYNYHRELGKDIDPKKGEVIDLTKKYRQGQTIDFLN